MPEPSDPDAEQASDAAPLLRNAGISDTLCGSANAPPTPPAQVTACGTAADDVDAAAEEEEEDEASCSDTSSVEGCDAAHETATDRCAATPGQRFSHTPSVAAGSESERTRAVAGAPRTARTAADTLGTEDAGSVMA